MTELRGLYWEDRVGTYQQPTVVNPPAFQNANNARHAIWHLGRMLTLHVYTSDQHVWRVGDTSVEDDGRHDRGTPLVLQVRGTFQPNTQKRGRGWMDVVESGRSETNCIVHLDSHDPVNLAAIAGTPGAAAVFPNGLRLVDPDDRGTDGIVNFPMAIVYRGNRWKIKQPIALYEGGDEELHLEGAIYRAECQLWHDRYHEQDAVNNNPVWGPE